MSGPRKKASRRSSESIEELEKTEKSGRCRRILCDILTLRMLGYIVKQPPSCTYIFTLFVIAGCLPFIGLYISRQERLPDLDTMQNWNSYIGKLGHNHYCFQLGEPSTAANQTISSLLPSYPPFNQTAYNQTKTTCVGLQFEVDRNEVVDNDGKVKNTLLIAEFTGQEIGTQIKLEDDGRRIDRDGVFVHLWVPVSDSTLNVTDPKACPDTHCKVNGSVLITALPKAIPTRLPQVKAGFTFDTIINNCHRNTHCPSTLCHTPFNNTADNAANVRKVTKDKDCSVNQLKVVNKHRFGAKVNDVIKIYLNKEDQQTAAHRMYLAAVGVASLSLVFTIGILLTDRPTEPKPSVE